VKGTLSPGRGPLAWAKTPGRVYCVGWWGSMIVLIIFFAHSMWSYLIWMLECTEMNVSLWNEPWLSGFNIVMHVKSMKGNENHVMLSMKWET